MNTIINIFKLVICLLLFMPLMSGSCNKEKFPLQVRSGDTYEFPAEITVSPEKEVYKIGDTITMRSVIPKILSGTKYGAPVQNVDYSNAVNIYNQWYFLSTTGNAKDSFNFIIKTGKIDYNVLLDGGITVYYESLNDSYSFIGKLICQKKGVYVISLLPGYSPGLWNKDYTSARFNIQFTNTNRHLELIKHFAQTLDSNEPLVYFFKVE